MAIWAAIAVLVSIATITARSFIAAPVNCYNEISGKEAALNIY